MTPTDPTHYDFEAEARKLIDDCQCDVRSPICPQCSHSREIATALREAYRAGESAALASLRASIGPDPFAIKHKFLWHGPERKHDFVHDGRGDSRSGGCQAYVQAGPMTALCGRTYKEHGCTQSECGMPWSHHVTVDNSDAHTRVAAKGARDGR